MTTEVTHRPESSRYELVIDGTLVGVADYRLIDGALVVHHTQIDPARQGNGLGAVLVGGMLEDVRASGRRVVPRCWYVAQYVDEHPEYRELLAR